jgi:hypothetical protein
MIIILKATVAVEKCLDQIFMELTWVLRVVLVCYFMSAQCEGKGWAFDKFCMV